MHNIDPITWHDLLYINMLLIFTVMYFLYCAQYFPDRFVRREILNLPVICLFNEDGCTWEGKLEEYNNHITVCEFATTNCVHCKEKLRSDEIKEHELTCPLAPKECPLATLGCTMAAATKDKMIQHMEEAQSQHLSVLATKVQSLEKRIEVQESQMTLEGVKGSDHLEEHGEIPSRRRNYIDEDGGLASIRHHDSGLGHNYQSLPTIRRKTEMAGKVPVSMPPRNDWDMQSIVESMIRERMTQMQDEVERNVRTELRAKDEEIAGLKTTITKMEKTMRAKNVEHEDRDFRLSLIENGNHDGSMIWKIPQFSQRKADAENGKYTSIFSLPFYTGRYGFKMCLRLYIMGDGIGKGTHLSLFFVVMRGEFDNILQWPFTHKVTFKLINQAGGRDIVDTFQPDPMSSSFKKPTSDMNVASGCPRFISHTELERGGFIVDDTIFIKCTINTATVRHP